MLRPWGTSPCIAKHFCSALGLESPKRQTLNEARRLDSSGLVAGFTGEAILSWEGLVGVSHD